MLSLPCFFTLITVDLEWKGLGTGGAGRGCLCLSAPPRAHTILSVVACTITRYRETLIQEMYQETTGLSGVITVGITQWNITALHSASLALGDASISVYEKAACSPQQLPLVGLPLRRVLLSYHRGHAVVHQHSEAHVQGNEEARVTVGVHRLNIE